MKRFVLWALGAMAAVVVLAAALALALPSLVDTPRVQSLIASSASHALGRPVRFESIGVTIFPLPAVVLRGLEVADDPRFAAAPFLKIDRGAVKLRVWPLLTGRVELGDVVLKTPLITVIQDAAGRWNFASLGAPSEAKPTTARPPASDARGSGSGAAGAAALGAKVKIEGGVVSYVARGASGAASKYRLEDLDLTLTTPGGALAFEGGVRVQPGDLAVTIAGGGVTLNGSKSLADGRLRGRVSLDGKDVKDLVAAAIGPTPRTSAAVKGALTLTGTVGNPRASGDVDFSNIAVTQTSPRCSPPKERTLKPGNVTLALTWDNGVILARPLETTVGKGTITTALTAAMAKGASVELKDLTLKSVPLEPVLVDFLCEGYAVTGPIDFTGNLSGSARDIWSTLSGAGQFRIGPGKVVGSQALALIGNIARVGGAVASVLSGDVPSPGSSSPLDFESITGTFQARNGVATTRDLVYTSRAMKISVAGDYALASGKMNLDVVLHHGRGDLAAKVSGTASSPSVQMAPSSIVQGIDRKRVESGLGDLLKRFR